MSDNSNEVSVSDNADIPFTRALVYGTDPDSSQIQVVNEFLTEIHLSPEYIRIKQSNQGDIDAYLSIQVLHRFLCARDYNLAKALTMIRNHIEWRFEVYRPFEILPEDVEPSAVGGCVHVSPRGKDVYGRPVLILDDSCDTTEIKNAKEKQKKQMQHLIFHMERCIRQINASQVRRYVVFINLENFKFLKAPNLSTTKETAHILGSQYPERLGLAVLYKAPWVFTKFFEAAKMFIDKVTREKIVFISGDTSAGSANDEKLTRLMGSNWRHIVGADLPRKCPKTTRGYDHITEWPVVVSEFNTHREIAK